jgi:hypothetical protein
MRMGVVVVAIVFVVTCEGGTFATSYVAALLGTPERQRSERECQHHGSCRCVILVFVTTRDRQPVKSRKTLEFGKTTVTPLVLSLLRQHFISVYAS